MDKIKIKINGRVAGIESAPEVVTDNAEYEVEFAVDERDGWNPAVPMTALFVRRDARYTAVVMDAGETICTMPPQTGSNVVYIGLTQEEMRTTTPARLPVRRSVRTMTDFPPLPDKDVYAQILDNFAELRMLSGKGAPTTETAGKVNQLYRDETNNRLYVCVNDVDGYTWAMIGGGGGGGTVVTIDTTLSKSGQAADAKAVGDAIDKKLDKAQGAGNAGKILGIGSDGNVTPQDKPVQALAVGAAPTTATAGVVGQEYYVIVNNAVTEMYVCTDVSNGTYTWDKVEFGGGNTTGISLGITGASVGQVAKITSIDSDGAPTAWGSESFQSGESVNITKKWTGNNLYKHSEAVGEYGGFSNCSNYIPVEAGKRYHTNLTFNHYTAYFDANKTELSGGVQAYSSDITPTQDGYVLVSGCNENTIIVEGTVPDNAHGDVAVLKNSVLPSRWNGKRWLLIGDSTSSTQYATVPYGTLVSRRLGMILTNVSVSGKTMANYNETVETYGQDYDLVTVMLGANDMGYNTAIGAISDEAVASGSFYARCKYMATKLMEKYPQSVIAFFTCLKRGDDATNEDDDLSQKTNAQSKTTQDFTDVIIDVCDFYGIPCLDISKVYNPCFAVQRKIYGYTKTDATHLNNLGHARILAPQVEDFLRKHAPYYSTDDYAFGVDFEKGTLPTIYSITNTLTNATNSNDASTVMDGEPYIATITANEGYVLQTVTCKMGGVEQSVTNGAINIASVSGDIVITGVAILNSTGDAQLVHEYDVNPWLSSTNGEICATDKINQANMSNMNQGHVARREKTENKFLVGATDSFTVELDYKRTALYACELFNTSDKVRINEYQAGFTESVGRIGLKDVDNDPYGGKLKFVEQTTNTELTETGFDLAKDVTYNIKFVYDADQSKAYVFVNGNKVFEKTGNYHMDGISIANAVNAEENPRSEINNIKVYKGVHI